VRPTDRRPGLRLVLLSLYAVVLISIFDAMTPSGAMMGILLSIPIFVVSAVDDRRAVWAVFAAAWLGFMLAAVLGGQSASPSEPDMLNRMFVILTLGASAYLALLLQRRRIEAQTARDAAIDTRETNRLLLSLIAHDLRAPLATALHTFDYLELSGGVPTGDDIVEEVRGRLRRSLGMVDAFLAIRAHDEGKAISGRGGRNYITGHQLGTILVEEVRTFETEAAARGKTLHVDVARLEHGEWLLDVLILRQTLAILLDNAVRYAVPGPVTVTAAFTDNTIGVRVEDRGPGLAAQSASSDKGAGLGLALCNALVRRFRGTLDVREGDEGTAFVLRLPVTAAP
jgi:signal transduction histidine kinase